MVPETHVTSGFWRVHASVFLRSSRVEAATRQWRVVTGPVGFGRSSALASVQTRFASQAGATRCGLIRVSSQTGADCELPSRLPVRRLPFRIHFWHGRRDVGRI